MKTILYACLLLFLSCNKVHAQEVPLSKGAALLFKDVTSRATNKEKNQLFELTNFQIVKNGTQFHYKEDVYAAEYPFDVVVSPVDINSDGIEEIGLMYGNSYTSGAAGASTILFIKNKDGNYEVNLGYPGFLTFLPTKHQGYIDMMIQGPGYEFAVWVWNGTAYDFSRKINSSESDTLELISLEEASKLYVAGLKN